MRFSSLVRQLSLVVLSSLFFINCSNANKQNALTPINVPIENKTTTIITQPIVPKDTTPLHLLIARKYVGVVEKTGHNDGPEIEMFLKSVGRSKGESYCAAFGSFSLTTADATRPILSPKIRSGLARDFTRDKNTVPASKILNGMDVIHIGDILIWADGNTIKGHFGFANKDWNGVSGETVEANTSSGDVGSQADGGGVYIRERTILKTAYFRIKWKIPVIYK